MASHLESLRPELLVEMVEYIVRASDLKALCLTSKTLLAPARARLYREVVLDESFLGWPTLPNTTGLLLPTNSGVAHI